MTDTYTPQVNGVTTVVRRIADVLAREGHDVAVAAPRYPGGEEQHGELRVRSLPFPPYPAIRLTLPLRGRVNAFLEAFRPDLVHVATEGPLGTMGRNWAVRRRVPLATSYHTHFPQYVRHYGLGLLEPLAWRWLVWFHRPARLTHTPGAEARDALRQHGITHAVIWGQGVDSRQFHPGRRNPARRRALGVRDDQVMVLHVGRLAPEKNVHMLARAWNAARPVLGDRAILVIAGEGPEDRALRASLPDARSVGFLDRGSLAELYASADLCVLPSKTETCGLVALEAMAAGLPVVAAEAGGFRESVRTGRNGVLVPPDDADAFGRAIAGLVIDPARRADLGHGARVTAERRDVRVEDAVLVEQYRTLAAVPQPGGATCAA